jgi:hypothetical protein
MALRQRFLSSPLDEATDRGEGLSETAAVRSSRFYVLLQSVPTFWMLATWTLIGSNWFCVMDNMTRIHFTVSAVVTLLCGACFAAVQTAHHAPSSLWLDSASKGLVESSVCKRSARLLPPRAAYCRRTDEVVVGLDHYCAWVGNPIGSRNRKAFLLYLCYSTALCLIGAVQVAQIVVPKLLELRRVLSEFLSAQKMAQEDQSSSSSSSAELPDFLGSPSPSEHELAVQAAQARLLATLSQFDALGDGARVVLFIADVVATVLLFGLARWQVYLAMGNRTTIAPNDDAYDLGNRWLNLQQIFGTQPLLWGVPINNGVGDGLSWPRQKQEDPPQQGHGRQEERRGDAKRSGD